MHVRLILLTCGTALDIFAHELDKTWPPEFRSDELASLEITGVTDSFIVMTMSKDGAVESSGGT